MPWLPKKCVVVPVDFSEDSFVALDTAMELAAPAGVHIVYVLPMLDPAEPGVIWTTVDNSSRSRHAEDAMRERLADKKYQGVSIDDPLRRSGQ